MSDQVQWDAGLIGRYDKPCPSYTSYPSPVQFAEGVLPTDLVTALQQSRDACRPLALYVHIPCFANLGYSCGSTRIITRERCRAQPYLRALHREIALVSAYLSPAQQVERLHLGGGTPTFLSHDELRWLMSRLRDCFNMGENGMADYSIEVDPHDADWPTMGLLRELGFNQVNFGVQDPDLDVQHAINRLYSLEQTQTVMDAARALAYRSVGIELIYGLPRQTPESFARTVAAVIGMTPDRVTLHSYAQRLSRRRTSLAELPGTDSRMNILSNSFAQLQGAGYRHIGLGQFALPDDSLSNARETGQLNRGLQGYVTGGDCDLIGLGVSAISQLGDFHCCNTSDIELYQQSLEACRLALHRGLKCTADDRVRREVINRLMCSHELHFVEIEQRFNIEFALYFADCLDTLRQMHRDGLIRLSEVGIDILPVGRPLVARICSLFDAYQQPTDEARHTRRV